MFGQGFDFILRHARQGDPQAWRALDGEFRPVIRGYLRGQGCPNPDDVTQETMLQVVRDLHRFEGDEARFRSWVFTIAHHRMVDARRSHASRRSDPTDSEVIEHALPAAAPSEDIAVGNATTRELAVLLEAVTEDQRDVLMLRYVADLSLHEVAAALGKEYGAVKALHRRGLEALRAHLAGAEYPSRGDVALTQAR